MNRLWQRLALLLCLCGAPSLWAQESIRLTNGEWEPYHSAALPHFGVGTRVVTEAFALVGISVEYGFFPWSRAFSLARDGEWDGTMPWGLSAEEAQHFYQSDVVFEGSWVFFHRKDYPFDWQTMADLKGIPLGATLEYEYGDLFHQAVQSGTIDPQWIPQDEQNFEKLLVGRIDLFPQDINVGYAQIRKNFPREAWGRFTHHPKAFNHKQYRLILSRQHQRNARMIALFNQGLGRLKASGKYDQYFAPPRQLDEKER